MPTVKWIFKGRITSSENIYAVENATAIAMECSAQEMIYTSTLQLPLYTTINESSDKTGTFYCRMEYHDTFWNINSSASQIVRFTAHVRSINLEPSGNIITSLDGNNVSLRCTTGPSRPAPVIRWWVDGNEVTNHSITKITDTSDFFIASSELHLNIDRTHQGKKVYCDARVSSQMNAKESVKPAINVWYAPDVRVNISESTVVGLTAVLMCTAQGEPPQYTFHPWKHRVGQTEIRRLNGVNKDSISILTLSNISIQDMGSYICTVDNSITGLDGQLYQKGHTSLYVKGPPHFGKTGSTFKGETGKSAIIKIPFYSSSPNITMKIKKNSDLCEMSNTSGVSIFVSPSEITMTFYTKKVMRNGHVAVLNYTNVTDGDFDNYTIHLSNEQGQVTMEFAFLGSMKMNTKLTDIDIEVVAGGIGIGVVLIAAMLFICCYPVKEKMFKCTLKRGHGIHTYENTEMGLQPVQPTSQGLQPVQPTYTEMGLQPVQPTYEELKKENVEQDTYDRISSLNVCCSI